MKVVALKHGSVDMVMQRPAGISALAWHPTRAVIAVGQADGAATLLSLE